MATYLMAKGNSGDIVKRQKNWIIRSKATNIKKITAIYEYYIKQKGVNVMSNIIMDYQDIEKLKKQYSKNSLQPYS